MIPEYTPDITPVSEFNVTPNGIGFVCLAGVKYTYGSTPNVTELNAVKLTVNGVTPLIATFGFGTAIITSSTLKLTVVVFVTTVS
jgi:hypothetical protein